MGSINTKNVWSYVWCCLRPFPFAVFMLVWVGCVWALDISVRPYLVKVILDRVAGVGENVFDYLVWPIAGYVGMLLTLQISYRIYDYIVNIKTVPNMRLNIGNTAFQILLKQSHNYYQNSFSGTLTNKVNDLTGSIPKMIQIISDRFFSHGLALVVAVITLFQVSMIFAIGMVVWIGVFVTVAWVFAEKLTKQATNWSELASGITGSIVDALSNILSIRLFSAVKFEEKLLKSTMKKAVVAEQEMEKSYLIIWCIYGLTFSVLQVCNFYFLCKGREEGWITVGDFALVLIINLTIIDFLWQIAEDFSEFSKLYGRIVQALSIIYNEPELKDKFGASELVLKSGDIVFDDVHFHYQDTQEFFHGVSVTIRSGEKVGLVGHSGGGKSTFVNLILRLYDVTSGSICIDGQDVRDVTQASLRKCIGMIPQDPSLFHRSISNNIGYGKEGATRAEIIAAAKEAYAHDFVSKLQHGYDSWVGERGVKLSGGQRQRIAIARAILKNAPILILDEATSQLDSLTEHEIQKSLWHLMQNKTAIVIAHRLSTLLNMDRIIVFEDGRIVQDGSHSKLLEDEGLYKSLWEAQVGGFLPQRLE